MMDRTKNVEAQVAKMGESLIIEKLGESAKDDVCIVTITSRTDTFIFIVSR